jgi:hypothetical protein
MVASCYSQYAISKNKDLFLKCKNGKKQELIAIERPSVIELRKKFARGRTNLKLID